MKKLKSSLKKVTFGDGLSDVFEKIAKMVLWRYVNKFEKRILFNSRLKFVTTIHAGRRRLLRLALKI